MSVKLLTEHRLEFVSLKGGYTGSSESTLENALCGGSIYDILASSRWVHSYLNENEKFRQVPQILFFMHAVRRFMLEFIEIVFCISCKPMKRRHS